MKKSKLSEAQIIGILSEAAVGISPRDLCRRCQISLATYYKIKNKYYGMTASDLIRLKRDWGRKLQIKKPCMQILVRTINFKGGA